MNRCKSLMQVRATLRIQEAQYGCRVSVMAAVCAGWDDLAEEVDFDVEFGITERFRSAVERDSSQLLNVWRDIMSLGPVASVRVAKAAFTSVLWDVIGFPVRCVVGLFQLMLDDSSLCLYGSFEDFLGWTLRDLGHGEGIAEGCAMECILAYSQLVRPNTCEDFVRVALECAMQADAAPSVAALLRSTIAVPTDLRASHLYSGTFRDCCALAANRPRCLMMYREHIQFEGNSKQITPDKLACMLLSRTGGVEMLYDWRNIIQAGPALSPSWLLQMAVRSCMKDRPEYPEGAQHSSIPAQCDTWLLQCLLTPQGAPHPVLLRILEDELELKKGTICSESVHAAGGALAAGAVKAGAGKHLDAIESLSPPGVLPQVAVALAWLVRLAHRPSMHGEAYFLLEMWRLAPLPPGEAAALRIFHAALAASPRAGYTYEPLASPYSKPWWLFHVDLNVQDNDCFWETTATTAEFRIERQRREGTALLLQSQVAEWLKQVQTQEQSAGPPVPHPAPSGGRAAASAGGSHAGAAKKRRI